MMPPHFWFDMDKSSVLMEQDIVWSQNQRIQRLSSALIVCKAEHEVTKLAFNATFASYGIRIYVIIKDFENVQT